MFQKKTPVLAALVLAAAVAAPETQDGLALVGGTLVDVSAFGSSTSDVRDSVVVIRGGEIVAAGPRKTTPVPAGVREIRVDGAYFVPGLTDAFAGLNSQAQANAYLYMGVTSIVGSDEPGGRRGALYTEARPSPRIHPLGIVSGLRRDWSGFVPLTTAEILAGVDDLARGGAKVLLLHYRLEPEQTRLVIRKAHGLGLATIGELGHTSYPDAIEAGIDAFVHTARYSLELASPEMRAAVADAPFGPPRTAYYQFLTGLDPKAAAVEQYARQLAKSRVALIPTLSLFYLDLPHHENPWKEPVAAILDPKGIHLPADPATGRRSAPEGIPLGLAPSLLRIEARYRRAGARYVAGSGTSAFGTLPGISLHGELKMLTDLGLSPRQALAAATSNVGVVFRWPKAGQVKKGFGADLLVLDADPLEDIRNLKKIRMVVLRGEVLDRDALAKPPAGP